jgi:predicted transcriptional regulator
MGSYNKRIIKVIEIDKNLKSLIKKGLVIKVGKGYTLSPLGIMLLGKKNGKPNKKGGKVKKK